MTEKYELSFEMAESINLLQNGRPSEMGSEDIDMTDVRSDPLPEKKEELTSSSSSRTKVYPRRWYILCLFALYSMSNAYQWIHLSIISDVMLAYYNESLPGDTEMKSVAVDWLSLVYMLVYVPLILPATWLLDRKGLRVIALLGTLLNCLGAWLKCASVSPDRFAVLMFAQTVCSIAQVFILGMPARVAAVWFGPDQVSTATAVGVFGNQIGNALGFLISPTVVTLNEDDMDATGVELSYLFYGGAGYTTLLFFIVLFSINVGVFYAISTLLNQIVLGYFNTTDYPLIREDAGRIGLTIVVTGLVGSVIAGRWLDKTKLFKMTTTVIYILSLGGIILFTFTLQVKEVWVVYVTAGALGFFMTSYLPVGFEFAAELTYPESEGTSSGLVNAFAQICGIALTLGMGPLMRMKGDKEVNIRNAMLLAAGLLLLGTILTCLTKNNLLRQKAETEKTELPSDANAGIEPNSLSKNKSKSSIAKFLTE